jgi:hypothetical protein
LSQNCVLALLQQIQAAEKNIVDFTAETNERIGVAIASYATSRKRWIVFVACRVATLPRFE